jgi:methyl-accepting chemotaxis protein
MQTTSKNGLKGTTAFVRCALSSISTARAWLPRADEIIHSRNTAQDAAQQLAASQANTRAGIIAVGIAMVALGLGFSWLIGRSITRPLNGLASVMARLADGDTSARIPATKARDEIGAMARTMIVFRDNMGTRTPFADTNRGEPRASKAAI